MTQSTNPTQSTDSTLQPRITEMDRKKKKSADYMEEKMIKIAEKLAKPLPAPPVPQITKEDHITYFLRSLEPALRALPTYKQSLAKIKMQTIIHEMTFGEDTRSHQYQSHQNATTFQPSYGVTQTTPMDGFRTNSDHYGVNSNMSF